MIVSPTPSNRCPAGVLVLSRNIRREFTVDFDLRVGYRNATNSPWQVLCIGDETYEKRFPNVAIVKYGDEINERTHSALKEGE